MLIKFCNILAIALIVVCSSCRKEESIYNKEDVFSKDTTTLVFKVTYLSHNAQDLNFQLELLTFNGDESEKLYNGMAFYPNDLSSEFGISFSNSSTQTYVPSNNYNTAVILDLSSKNLYDYHNAGIYLRRYFEIADSLPNRNLALSSLDPAKNHPTRFHTQYPGNIFGNSWQYNTQVMYELISEQTQTSSGMTVLFFKNRVLETIDSLVAELGVLSQKSITLVMSIGGFAGESNVEFDEIIAKANANNVKINIITEYEDVSYQRIAFETGGFSSGVVPDIYGNYGEPYDSLADPIQSVLLNLDALLSSNVSVHRIDMKITKQVPEVWISGENKTIYFEYNQKRRSIQVKVP